MTLLYDATRCAAGEDDSAAEEIRDPSARRLVQLHLQDRVAILPQRLEFAVVPVAIYAKLGVTSSRSTAMTTPSSSTSAAATPPPPTTTTTIPTAGPEDDAEPDTIYLTVDERLVYARFFADFGPLDLGQSVAFCRELTQRLQQLTLPPPNRNRTLLLVSSDHPHKRTNAMALLALFLVCVDGQSPRGAVAVFRGLRAAHGFRDAACGVCPFTVTIYDCARAVHKAIQRSIWRYESFDLDAYRHYDQLYNGDINWIVPGKILAFSGPQRERIPLDAQGNKTTLLAPEYATVFKSLGVSCVVRLNEPTTYDRRAFIQANIRHVRDDLDMHYPDGGNPTDEILFQFIRTCERESGAVAVHCKAGLGRTGTNIAAYLMKNHGFSAVEAIAWCRLCRPGSIVGPQQQYLVVKQPQLWQLHARALATEDGDQQQQPTTLGGPQQRLVRVKKPSFTAMLQRLPSLSPESSAPSATKRSSVEKANHVNE